MDGRADHAGDLISAISHPRASREAGIQKSVEMLDSGSIAAMFGMKIMNTHEQSQRAWESAAIEQDVLAGDKARLRTAQKRAGKTEFFRVAKPPRRI